MYELWCMWKRSTKLRNCATSVYMGTKLFSLKIVCIPFDESKKHVLIVNVLFFIRMGTKCKAFYFTHLCLMLYCLMVVHCLL